MKGHQFTTRLPVVIGALLLAAPLSHAATDLPPTQRMDGIDYVTGGIGSAESSALLDAGRSWPLTLEFAVRNKQRAEYAAGVAVVVRNAKQDIRFRIRSDGPFVLARLAPGNYTVDATLDGQTLRRAVTLRAGSPAKVLFIWPQSTGTTPP